MNVQPLVVLAKETGMSWQLTSENDEYTLDTHLPTTRTQGSDLVAVISETVKKVRYELDI